MKNNAVIILEALLEGMEFTWYNNQIVIVEESQLAFRLQKFENGSTVGQDYFVGCDMTVTQFIQQANLMSEDQIAIIAANLSLNKSKEHKHRELPKPPLGGSGESRG